MPVITQTRERYVRSARLRANADGGATLWAIAWEGELERVLAWELDAEGAVQGEPREAQRAPAIPDIVLADTGDAAPVEDPGADDEAHHDGWTVRVTREAGESRVIVGRPGAGDATVVAWRARGFAA